MWPIRGQSSASSVYADASRGRAHVVAAARAESPTCRTGRYGAGRRTDRVTVRRSQYDRMLRPLQSRGMDGAVDVAGRNAFPARCRAYSTSCRNGGRPGRFRLVQHVVKLSGNLHYHGFQRVLNAVARFWGTSTRTPVRSSEFVMRAMSELRLTPPPTVAKGRARSRKPSSRSATSSGQ